MFNIGFSIFGCSNWYKTHFSHHDEELLDPKSDKTCSRLKKEVTVDKTNKKDVATHTLMDYAIPSTHGAMSSIKIPEVQINTFEISSALIQLIQISMQFRDLPNEDPNAHIASFLEMCDTFNCNGITDDAIRLRLFPLSL